MPNELWCLSDAALAAPTSRAARDAIVECFFHAQRETYARSAAKLGRPTSDDDIRKAVAASVRTIVREVGGDWDAPTVDDLRSAVALLGQRAAAWGTPDDIVQHHGRQIMRLLEAAERAQG